MNRLIKEIMDDFDVFKANNKSPLTENEWDFFKKSWFLDLLDNDYYNQSYLNLILCKQKHNKNYNFGILNESYIFEFYNGFEIGEFNINEFEKIFLSNKQKNLIDNFVVFKNWLLNEDKEKEEKIEINNLFLDFIQSISKDYLLHAIKYLFFTDKDKFSLLIDKLKENPNSINIKEIVENNKKYYEVLFLKSGKEILSYRWGGNNEYSTKEELKRLKNNLINNCENILKVVELSNDSEKFNLNKKIENLKNSKDWRELLSKVNEKLNKEYKKVFIEKEGIKIELLDNQNIFSKGEGVNVEFIINQKTFTMLNLPLEKDEEKNKKYLLKDFLPVETNNINLNVNDFVGLKYLKEDSFYNSISKESDYKKAYIILKTEKNDLIGALSVTSNKNNKKFIELNTVGVCEQFRNKRFAKILYQALKSIVKDRNIILKRDLALISEVGRKTIKKIDFNELPNVIEFKYSETKNSFKDIINNENYYIRDNLKYRDFNEVEFNLIMELEKKVTKINNESFNLKKQVRENLLASFNETIEEFEFEDFDIKTLNKLLKIVDKYENKIQIDLLLNRENLLNSKNIKKNKIQNH
jgi:hypothetical protein